MSQQLKDNYKDAKKAFESASDTDKAAFETLYKTAKHAYKNSKKNNDIPVDSSITDEDAIAKANAAFFEAETPVDSLSATNSTTATTTTTATTATSDSEDVPIKKKRKRKRKKKNGEESTQQQATGEERKFHSMGKALETESLTIFVGGISYDATEDDLSDFFSDCGKINSVRVPKYQDSGKPRGYAHIDFATEDGVKKALAKNRSTHMGRYLDIKLANRKRSGLDFDVSEKPPGCKTVFIKNLPYDTNEKEVFSSFQFCGKITEVRLVKWQHTNKLKGIGYVQFQKEESAEIAVKKRGEIKVGGRAVLVDFEGGKPKASYRDTEGRSYAKTNSFSNKRARSTGPKM